MAFIFGKAQATGYDAGFVNLTALKIKGLVPGVALFTFINGWSGWGEIMNGLIAGAIKSHPLVELRKTQS